MNSDLSRDVKDIGDNLISLVDNFNLKDLGESILNKL
jgi:hypothetical protein